MLKLLLAGLVEHLFDCFALSGKALIWSGRVRYLDSEPALGHLRFWEIADGESGQRIVRIRFGGVNGKHCQVFAYHPSISSTAILSPLSVKL